MMAAAPVTRASLPGVTVLLPCRNEVRYIGPCLDSILAGDYPQDRLEVLVLDGMSDDGTRTVLADYARRHPAVRVLDNPRRIAPAALNIGIRDSRHAILVRMDAHLHYPPGYLRGLVTALLETGADSVGGVLRTLPASNTAVAQAIAVAMAHPLAVGNSYFRIGTRERRWVDTVAFFCVRRELFDRVGTFDEELVRGQDDEFNARLLTRGGRILLTPDVEAQYYARATLGQVARMFFQYGYFKPLAARKLGRVVTLRQLVPPAFVLALGATAIAAPWWPPGALALAGVLAAYGIVVASAVVPAVGRHGLATALALGLVLPVVHLSYGCGFWKRAIELARRPRTRARSADLPMTR